VQPVETPPPEHGVEAVPNVMLVIPPAATPPVLTAKPANCAVQLIDALPRGVVSVKIKDGECPDNTPGALHVAALANGGTAKAAKAISETKSRMPFFDNFLI
jgi:hypothetical protein